jgi:CheY-like chemotaxis protein
MAKKILIVDDEPDIRTFISAVLEEHGYSSIKRYSRDRTDRGL